MINKIFLLLLVIHLNHAKASMFGEETAVLVDILKTSLDQLEQMHDIAEKSGKTLEKIQKYNTALRDLEYKALMIENMITTTSELSNSNLQSTQDLLNLLYRVKGECRTLDQLLQEERQKLASSKKADKAIQDTHNKGRFDRKIEKHQLSQSRRADTNVAEATKQTAINTSWLLKSSNDIKDYQNRQLDILNKSYTDSSQDRSRDYARDIEKKQFYNFDYGINSKAQSKQSCLLCLGSKSL